LATKPTRSGKDPAAAPGDIVVTGLENGDPSFDPRRGPDQMPEELTSVNCTRATGTAP
jgi:hypothetical protein